MNNTAKRKAKDAIIKRVDNALKDMGIDPKTTTLQEALHGKDDKAKGDQYSSLQNAIGSQAKELVAQIGRVNSFSMKDGQDVRGNRNLHAKYTDKANKMDAPTFDKNALDALEHENEKDSRGLLGNFKHALWKKPASMFASILRDDKPILDSGDWKIIACVAMVLLCPPANIVFGLMCLGKALKNDIYDGSKLQEWVNDKWYKKEEPTPEKFNTKELDGVTVQKLVETPEPTKTSARSTEASLSAPIHSNGVTEMVATTHTGTGVAGMTDTVRQEAIKSAIGLRGSVTPQDTIGVPRGPAVMSEERRRSTSNGATVG